LGIAHVKTLLSGETETLGASVFSVIVTEADAVHEFSGSVTVTVYTPATVAVAFTDVFPPPQL
jgi:hypothetical protein